MTTAATIHEETLVRARRAGSLSIVLVSHDRPGAIAATLRELGAGEATRGVETVVVDNGSRDGTASVVEREFPSVRLVRLATNTGVAAFNEGVARTTGAFVLVLDDDARPNQEALAAAVALLEREPGVGAVALHPIVPPEGRSEWPFARSVRGVAGDWPLFGWGRVVRRAAWEAVAGFEAGFFLYSNDTDLALKLLGAGWGVHFDPAWVVRHYTQTAFRRPRMWYRLAPRNRIWMARRHAAGAGWIPHAVLAWAEAHRRAGLHLPSHAAAARAAMGGLVRRPPPLPAGAGMSGAGLRRLVQLRWTAARSRPRRGGAEAWVEGAERAIEGGSDRGIRAVTAVIPSHGRHEDVRSLLGDLAAQRAGVTLRALVVDNASSPPLAEIEAPRGLDVVRVRLPENVGGAGGFNAGMRRALRDVETDAVWLLDSDVRLGPGALSPLVNALRARTDLAGVGSALRDAVSGVTYEVGGLVSRTLGIHMPAASGEVDPDRIIGCDYVAACSVLVRRGAIERAGVMPEVFLSWDDIGWCIGITRATGLRWGSTGASVAVHPWRKHPGIGRYYAARNCFGVLAMLGAGARVRWRRATLEVAHAAAATICGDPDAAELHLTGLADAAGGRGLGVGAVMGTAVRAMPLSELASTVAGLVMGRSPRVWVHPGLMRPALGSGGLGEQLARLGIDAAGLGAWRGDSPTGALRADVAGAIKRLLTGSAADVAIVPPGWPLCWVRGKTVVVVAGETFTTARSRPWRHLPRVLRCIARGVVLAARLAARAPGVAYLPPLGVADGSLTGDVLTARIGG